MYVYFGSFFALPSPMESDSFERPATESKVCGTTMFEGIPGEEGNVSCLTF